MGDFLHLSNTAAELNQSVRVSALLTVQSVVQGVVRIILHSLIITPILISLFRHTIHTIHL